jgi:hypothetical protein
LAREVRLLDLDHIGAEVGQDLPGEERSHAVAELDHYMAGERQGRSGGLAVVQAVS